MVLLLFRKQDACLYWVFNKAICLLLLFHGCYWRLFWEKRQCWMALFDWLQFQRQVAYISFRVLKIQIGRNSIQFFSKVLIQDSSGSLGSLLRLLLKLLKVLFEVFRDMLLASARECRLGWFRDWSDGALLLLWLLQRVGYVEKAWNDRCVATFVWLFSPAWKIGWNLLESRRIHPDDVKGATMVRRAPFFPGSIPAYIEQSMTPLICLCVIVLFPHKFSCMEFLFCLLFLCLWSLTYFTFFDEFRWWCVCVLSFLGQGHKSVSHFIPYISLNYTRKYWFIVWIK